MDKQTRQRLMECKTTQEVIDEFCKTYDLDIRLTSLNKVIIVQGLVNAVRLVNLKKRANVPG